MGFRCVWIAPNIDTNADAIRAKIAKIDFMEEIPAWRYAPIIKNASCVVGNSSSGIRDAPFFGTPSVNIGDRQNGREKPPSVMDVPVDRDKIRNMMQQTDDSTAFMFDENFQ